MLKENDDAKLLILCNPSNPTGGVHTEQRLRELAAVLDEYPNVAVLADEIYERLCAETVAVAFGSSAPFALSMAWSSPGPCACSRPPSWSKSARRPTHQPRTASL